MLTRRPLAAGEEIWNLIPQRPPIVMVDTLYEAGETGAVTGLGVTQDNIFVEDGCLAEPGIIEHVAQSAALFAGYPAWTQGLPPSLGYIAELKKFTISRLPSVGERLVTSLTVLGSAAGMSLISAEVRSEGPGSDQAACSDGLVASGQMKIFIAGQQ